MDVTKEQVEAILSVHSFFQDIEKTALWFNTPNPMLGFAKPRTMFEKGRGKKLVQFINAQLDSNMPMDNIGGFQNG